MHLNWHDGQVRGQVRWSRRRWVMASGTAVGHHHLHLWFGWNLCDGCLVLWMALWTSLCVSKCVVAIMTGRREENMEQKKMCFKDRLPWCCDPVKFRPDLGYRLLEHSFTNYTMVYFHVSGSFRYSLCFWICREWKQFEINVFMCQRSLTIVPLYHSIE